MNRHVSRALLGALSICSTAVCLAAAPQYAVVDLGATTFAGAGLVWQPHDLLRQTPPNWPTAGGDLCPNQPVNHLGAQFGDIAVGSTCLKDEFGGVVAQWTISASGVTLKVLGTLPGARAGLDGPFAEALDFNSVGDIVGFSNSPYDTYIQPSHAVAEHGFIYNNGNWTELIPIAGVNYDSMAEGVNDSHEVVGYTQTISSTTGAVLHRAFVYINGTMYNLSFYLVGGPTVLLSDAYGIDCQGNISAVGTPASGGTQHSYLLVRQGTARTNCPK